MKMYKQRDKAYKIILHDMNLITITNNNNNNIDIFTRSSLSRLKEEIL